MRSLLILAVCVLTLEGIISAPSGKPTDEHHNKISTNLTDKTSASHANTAVEPNEVSNMKEKINGHQDSIESTPPQHKAKSTGGKTHLVVKQAKTLGKPVVKPVAKRAAVNKLSARRKRDASEYLQEPIVVEDLEDLALLINALQRLNDLNGVEESSQNLYLPGTGEEEGMGPERFESEQEDPELIPESVARALLAAQEENEGDEEADRYERPRRGGYGRYGGYGRSPFRSLYYRRSLRSSMDDESPGEIDDEGIGYPLVDPEAVEEENIEEMLDEAELEDRIAKLARAILSREEKRRKK